MSLKKYMQNNETKKYFDHSDHYQKGYLYNKNNHIRRFLDDDDDDDYEDDKDNRNGKRGGDEPKRPNIMVFVVITIIALLLISYFMGLNNSSKNKEISYNEFITMIEKDAIDSVVIESDRIDIVPVGQSANAGYSIFQNGGVTYFTGLVEDKETVTSRLLEHDIEIKGRVEDGSSVLLSFLLSYVLPIVLLWIVFGFIFRRISKSGGMGFGVGKSNAKVYSEKSTGVTFKDVAGEEEAKESLVEIVDFLHNPDKYANIGAKLPKGALLVGPPGTGKTLLAKAVAGEAGVPFFSLAGSDFIELYVGVGASRVRDLFKEAEKNAPCIIFIDEIDAIGRSRDSKMGGGNEEREQTLNQLLSEMDGFDGKKGIIILAATNRPEILDKALLRPGRFDRRVIVEEPDLKGRIDILKVHAKNVKMDESVNLEAVGLATVGAVGADLANMINEAAILAVKGGRNFVNQKDLLDAVELVIMGKEKKDKLMSKKEREIVSYHEVGHALISALQKNSEPVQKITIIPRTSGALGYVMSYPEEEKFMQTEAELRAELVSLLGGRAAEDIVFDTVTTGAANDIEKATKIARAMITRFGMSKKFGLIGLESVESQYLDHRAVMNCADETAAEIDEEVMKILKESYKEAKKLLKENRDILDKIAAHLIKQETITGHEFMEIFCKEKGIPMPTKDKNEESLNKYHEQQRQEELQKAQEKAAQAYGAQVNYRVGADQPMPGQPYNSGNNQNGTPNANPYGYGQQPAGQNNPYGNGQQPGNQNNPYGNGFQPGIQNNPYSNGPQWSNTNNTTVRLSSDNNAPAPWDIPGQQAGENDPYGLRNNAVHNVPSNNQGAMNSVNNSNLQNGTTNQNSTDTNNMNGNVIKNDVDNNVNSGNNGTGSSDLANNNSSMNNTSNNSKDMDFAEQLKNRLYRDDNDKKDE